jgi:hypothetical protein
MVLKCRSINNSPFPRLSLAIAALILSGVHHMGNVFGEQSYCDPLLVQPKNNPYGYRFRGDRCEGQYVQEVASTALVVASFTSLFEDYQLTLDESLQVEWPHLGENEVRLRAYGLRWKLYYRMDAITKPEETWFSWPIALLAALNIPKQNLGIVGKTKVGFGNAERDVYLPLRITQKGENTKSNFYHLILWPGVQVTEVYVSLATVGEHGQPKDFFQESRPLQRGPYPAQRAIDIPLSDLPGTGFLYVEIGTTLQDGRSTTIDLLLYHPSN